LDQLHKWSTQKPNHGFALSNPKFEYWLLLHFEDGIGVTSSRECSERIRRWIAGYDKALDTRKISNTAYFTESDRRFRESVTAALQLHNY